MILRDFNLLATTSRGNETNACSELSYLLEEAGESEPKLEKTNISGLFTAKTTLNPFLVIKKLRTILIEHPYEFRYVLRIIPINQVISTDMTEIIRVSTELSSGIDEDQTFRVTVEKRFTNMSSQEIIEAVAANIQRKVDLERPDRVMLIEILGGLTGVSLIKPDDIISVTKEKLL
ncbi:MAG: THUMP domain-containing protein [Candidatus Bathyarchaeota archaeon]|jgi:tRNA acetyltransferase TAN1